jgi:endothelin-converting enzyme/putative endopeptidase
MRSLTVLAVLVLCAGLGEAQQTLGAAGSTPVPSGKLSPGRNVPSVASAASAPIHPSEPKSGAAGDSLTGFDVNALDRTVDPCVDFYKFACGAWMASHPIPPDQSRWGRFNELQEHNREVLHQILEALAAPDSKRGPLDRKIGDYYASCMDEKAIDALGLKPIQPDLDRIAAIRDRSSLLETMAYLYRGAVESVFSFYPAADLHDATMELANLDQGGLSLPDRDYYLKGDARSIETRDRYRSHVARMFELLGDQPALASAEAETVLRLETRLAEASMDRTERRDPNRRDHKMSTQAAQEVAPNLELERFVAAVDAPPFTTVNMANPAFFKAVNAALSDVPVEDWKTYLRWHLLHASAAMLPQPFVDEDFGFWSHYLGGQKELEARWKRCVRSTDELLGEALGQIYVDRAFGSESKQRTLKMVEAIERAMGEDIGAVPWMSPTTKAAARAKLAKVANNIGYPDKWRDYSTLRVQRGDAMGNFRRAAAFETRRQLNKIGKPVDRKEWGMTPPTVNAYYRPSNNDINFPAGILQPPFFDPKMDDAVNFGAIGAVIGHELTHGFDDQGAKFDPDGNLRDWWSPQDLAEFQQRGQCLADEYSGFIPVDDLHLNGKLTLGENTADNGGVRLSYMAFDPSKPKSGLPGTPSQERLKSGPQSSPRDGFTPEQRFFLGYAQIWCQNITPEQARLRILTDPHSPGAYRVNGVVVNMPEFQNAFGCKAGQPMVSANACRTW